MIYFVFSPDDPRLLVKIGYTRGSVADRVAQMQTGHPLRLCVIMALEGRRALEMELHRRFCKSRVHGEWFKPTDDLKEFIRESLGSGLVQSYYDTLNDPDAIRKDASILGWTEDEVRNGLNQLIHSHNRLVGTV